MEDLRKTELEFDRFVEKLGYQRVSDDVGFSPIFENADYVNKENRVTIELKILNKEFFENGGVIDSLRALIIKPVSIDESGCGQYTFQLPEMNRENKCDNFEEPLRRVLKKANKQLKETRSYYWGDSESFGFLLLAQVGLSMLSPEITGHLIRKILNTEFHSIDGVIICTPYFSLIDPSTMRRNPECVSVWKETNLVAKNICIDIANKWIKYYENSGHKR
jgi:hypothetical protein